MVRLKFVDAEGLTSVPDTADSGESVMDSKYCLKCTEYFLLEFGKSLLQVV